MKDSYFNSGHYKVTNIFCSCDVLCSRCRKWWN